MGLFDALTGRRKIKAPAPDRLFAITTAYIQLEAEHGIRTRGSAALVFQPLATGDFERIVADMEEVLRGTGGETGSAVETSDDDIGYRWMIVHDDDVEDLAVGVNAVSDQLQLDGYAERLLCAVFAFQDAKGAPVYFIYNYKRGAWYPFVPQGDGQDRSVERELQMKAIVGADLPIEPEVGRWFPLWGIPI
ncbi:MAG: hypothetical protein MUC84_00095 [Solirubrobacteraceae bacterium]|jgi:hypothetical protein|nr:hypothetical protein [Solirubrobacteraceae bacterium]MCU0312447.1 hypothetical protein [Solirubrobacteraceae bacterium]